MSKSKNVLNAFHIAQALSLFNSTSKTYDNFIRMLHKGIYTIGLIHNG